MNTFCVHLRQIINYKNMDLTTLQTEIDYRRRDTTSSFVTADETRAYLNAGLRDLGADTEWEWTQTSAAITYVDTANAWALSAIGNVKAPIDLFYTDDYEFEYVNPEDFDRLSANNLNIYSFDRDYLKIKSSFGSATLYFNFYTTNMAKTSGDYWQAALVSATDEPLVPERFQDGLIDYACMKIYQKEGLTDDYQISKSDYEKKKYLMKREYPSKRKYALGRWKHVTESQTAYHPLSKTNPLGQ